MPKGFSQKSLPILLVFIFSNCFAQSSNTDPKYIFISSNAGDRSHSALNIFLNKNALKDEKVFFCRSSEDAIKKAISKKGLVFLKLASIPNFYLHDDASKALQTYTISKIHVVVKQKAKYSLLRHERALKDKIRLEVIASTPHTLKVHQAWLKSQHLLEVEVPSGSVEAARLLSEGTLGLNTGVITNSHASNIYPNLKVVKADISSSKTYDIFALVEVKKRKEKTSSLEVKKEVSHLFSKSISANELDEINDELLL